jgi:hypothetical protein
MKFCLAVLWSFHWKVLFFKIMDLASLNWSFFSSNSRVSEIARIFISSTRIDKIEDFFGAQQTHWHEGKKKDVKGWKIFFSKSNSTSKRTFLSIPRPFRSDMAEMYLEFLPLFLFNVCISCVAKKSSILSIRVEKNWVKILAISLRHANFKRRRDQSKTRFFESTKIFGIRKQFH